MLLAIRATLGDHLLDLLVLARVERAEGKVLELPLERVDAEPVRERRVDLERLTGLAHLRLLAHVLDRAQVVQPVGELDQDHPDVLGHRDHELAVVLRLRLLAALELHSRQLGHALDELRDLLAELGPDVVDLDPGVLDHVVQERGGERRLVHPQAGEDLRRAPGVEDELLAGASHLPVVRVRGVVERAGDELPIGVRLVGLDLGDQLVDEILMPFEYRHHSSVAGRVFGIRRRTPEGREQEKPPPGGSGCP